MADQWTGTTGANDPQVNVNGYFKKGFLTYLKQLEFLYAGWGKKSRSSIPRNAGDKITWERPQLPPPATDPYPEFETRAPLSKFQTETVDAEVDWYGDHFLHSHRMLVIAQNGSEILSKMKEVQVWQYNKTWDILARTEMCGGSQTSFAGGTTEATCNAVVSLSNMNYARMTLMGAYVPTLAKKVGASSGVLTTPLDEGYVAIMHTDLLSTFESMTGENGWKPFYKYASTVQRFPGEQGSILGGQIRCCFTPAGYVAAAKGAAGSTYRGDGSNYDVYRIVVFGKDFMGEADIAGEGFEYIYKNAGGGSDDPHNQRGSAAWHDVTVFKRLDEARAVTVYTCAPKLFSIS